MALDIKINDVVVASDEENYILYKVANIIGEKALIDGVNYRVRREVLISILRKASSLEIENENKKTENYKKRIINIRKAHSKKYILGKILHLDGDRDYLYKCLELYEKVGIYAYGDSVNEENMYNYIKKYIYEINPDIIVLTGHDLYNGKGLKDLNNYVNSGNFTKVIKEIRKIDKNAVIIAGACQSNFEALVASGADFASSPKRINIHTYDPAVIAIKVATTSFIKIVNLQEVYKYIEDGADAFGGLETLGKMRLLL